MPKKTKRQKLLAEQRRHLNISSTPVESSVKPKDTTAPLTFHLQEKVPSAKPKQTMDDAAELAVIKKDLTKTIVLAVLAIAVELGIHGFLVRGT